jgi:hypothetical protein
LTVLTVTNEQTKAYEAYEVAAVHRSKSIVALLICFLVSGVAQRNVLFGSLTVQEHLTLMAAIRGITGRPCLCLSVADRLCFFPANRASCGTYYFHDTV